MNRFGQIVLGAAGLVGLTGATGVGTASAAPDPSVNGYSFAVIGDLPYGAAQLEAFPGWIRQINEDSARFTLHLGDIKSGSTRCDDEYYQQVKAAFNSFEQPLIYTPGDNEWTDCHRTSNGGYDPLERLAYDRSVFFAEPGRTLGQHPMKVQAQSAAGFPENIRFHRADVEFAMIHVVGSNNDLAPWSGIGNTAATAEQIAEQQARMDNAIAVLAEAFADARQRHRSAVVIGMQADMFDPSYTPEWPDISAFAPLVQAIVEQSSAFDGEVYLLNGDSHTYTVDQPLAQGSSWLSTYSVQGSADNLTRITVDGSSNSSNWLRVTVKPGAAQVLSWQQVPYTS